MKIVKSVVVVVCILLTLAQLGCMLQSAKTEQNIQQVNADLMDRYDLYISNQLSYALADVQNVKPVYRLNDNDLVAPKPDPEGFGESDDPASLDWLLEDASELLGDQSTLFTPQTVLMKGTSVRYYLDESIFALTWKQVVDDCVYSFAEIKIAHASQFRRFLSGGAYGSGVRHTTTEMSESVNAVVASSGDYYGYRGIGVIVNNGQVYRSKGAMLDTCYIDNKGDLLFTYRGEIKDQQTAERFVEENNVRLSLSFGPVMILDSEVCVPSVYPSGEINDNYPRAALCQLGPLHYVIVTANVEGSHGSVPTVAHFAQKLLEMGIPKAYTIDGGQTASIAMNHKLINRVSYNSQRDISDIIYFATALPEE